MNSRTEKHAHSARSAQKRGTAAVHGVLYRILTLRFLDDTIEHRFEEHHYHQNWRHIRLAILLSILVFVLFGAIDYVLLPGEYMRVWGIRLLAYVPFSLLLLILTYTKHWRVVFAAGPFAVLIAGVSLIIPITSNPLHASPEYFVGMLLFLLFGYTLLRVRFVWMVRAGLFMTLSYELVLLFLVQVDTETFLVSTLFLIAANSIGVMASYAIERFARRDFVQTMLLADSADGLALSISYRDQHIKQFIEASTEVVLFRLLGEVDGGEVAVVEYSEALLHLLGVEEDQAKDLTQWFIHTEKPGEVARAIADSVVKGGHYQADVQMILPGVGKRWLRLAVVGAKDIYEGRRSALGILIDQTEERNHQERQASLLDQKTKFLNITGHQLNTPLNMMKWGLESIPESEGSAKKMSNLMRGMHQATERMTRVLHDVFAAMSLSDEAPALVLRSATLADVLTSIRQRFANEKRLQLPGDRELGAIELTADTDKLAFCVERLVENALDYSQGAVRLSAGVSGQRLVLRVEDEGIGIPPSERPFVFQLFYRGQQAISMQPNRTGISLYIARSYIEAHQGHLRLDTSHSNITAFVVDIPLRLKEDA